jgi:hypothetical protein
MALISTLYDDFNDNSVDTAKWNVYTNGVASIQETNGQVLITNPPSTVYSFGGYTSLNTYDLTDGSVMIEVVNINPNVTGDTFFSTYNPNIADAVNMHVTSGQLFAVIQSSSGSTTTFSVPYDATNHRWWRIRHTSSPNKVWLETSPTGNSGSWTNILNGAISFSVTAFVAEFSAGVSGSNGSTIYSIFDNLNVLTSSTSIIETASDGGTSVLNAETASFSIIAGGSGGGLATYLTEFQPLPQVDYEYRVSDHSGNFIGIWQNVTSDFGYSQAINENASEMTVSIARYPDMRIQKLEPILDSNGAAITDENSDPILVQTETSNSVGPGTDIVENYNVDVYKFYGGYDNLLDSDGTVILDENNSPILAQFGAPNGKRVYSGYIADYDLTFGKTSGVDVLLVPQATEMSHSVFKTPTGDTTVSYNSSDPVQMARDAMGRYNAEGGIITYSDLSMPLSGQVSSYDFKLQTTRESIDKTVDLLPVGYYQFVDPGELVQYLLQKSTTPHHTFYYEQHITELKLKKSITQLVNDVYFVGEDSGSGPLFKHYQDLTSQTTYRRGLERMSDSRVSLATSAQALSQGKINDFKDPRYRTSVTITDAVYDIEEIKLGQMVAFKNFASFVDDLVLQIVNLNKGNHSVTLDLDMVVPSDAKRLEEIKRNILSEQIRDIATAPS